MKIGFKKLHPEAKLPSYGHPTDAGMDFFTLDEVILKPGEQKLIPTGLSIDLPIGYVAVFWDKSSLASQKGLKSLGGVIDSGYTGEMKIILINLSNTTQIIPKGAKFIQLLIQPVEHCEVEFVDEIATEGRGSGGFGSTGEF
jgi:dUTP pyrophosphatase